MTWFDVYLFTRLDALCFACQLGAMLTGLGVATALFMSAVFHDDYDEKFRVLAKQGRRILIPLFCVFAGLSLFTPNTKEFAAIYLIPKIANNEQVQQISENAMKLLNMKFQAWIEEMEPAK